MSKLHAFIEDVKRSAARADQSKIEKPELSDLFAKAILAGLRTAHSREGSSDPEELSDYVFVNFFILAEVEGYEVADAQKYLKDAFEE